MDKRPLHHLLSEEDDLILTYSSRHQSKVLKIRVQPAHDQRLLNLFSPGILHPPRSLWSLNSEPFGTESHIWAIFDHHEHACAALQALGDPSLVQPAQESDLPPSTVLRKLNVNDWIMRRHPLAHSNPKPASTSSVYTPPSHQAFHLPMRSTFISTQFQNLDDRSRYLHEYKRDANPQKGEDNVMDCMDTSGIATPPSIMDTPIPASSRPSKPSITNQNNSHSQTLAIPGTLTPTFFSSNNNNNISNLGRFPHTAGNRILHAGGGSQENGAARPAVPDHRTTAASTTSASAHAQRLLPLFSPTTLVDDDGNHDDSTPISNLDVSTRAPLSLAMGNPLYCRAINVNNMDPADKNNRNGEPLCGNLNFIGYSSGPTIHSNSSITFPPAPLSSTDASISAQSLSSSATTSSLSSPISEEEEEASPHYPRSTAGDQERFANKEEHPEDVSTLGFMLNSTPAAPTATAHRPSLTEHVNRLGGNVKVIEADFQTPAHHQSYGLSCSLTMSSSSSSSSSSPSQPSPHVAHITPSPPTTTAAAAVSSNKLRISTSATAHGTKITKTDAKFIPSVEGTSSSPLGPPSAATSQPPPPPQPFSRSYSFPVAQHSHVLDSDQAHVGIIFQNHPQSSSSTREIFSRGPNNVPNDVPSVPVATFRQGDWFCPLPTCGAHNFGRNVACIICGAAKISAAASLLSLSGFGPNTFNLGKNNSSSGTTAATVGSSNVGIGAGSGVGTVALSALFVDPSLSLTSHTNSATPFESGNEDPNSNTDVSASVAIGTLGNDGSRAMAMGMGMGTGVGTALNGPASQFGSSSSNAVAAGTLSQRRTSSAATTPLDNMNETTFSSSAIPLVSRHTSMGGVGALATVNGAFANNNSNSMLNTESVHALGGIHEVTAIQEAIKAHQSAKDKPRVVEKVQQHPSVTFMPNVSQRNTFNGGFPPSAAIGGQLLIPTTLGNSPPTPSTQGPLVINSNNGGGNGNSSQSQHSLARRNFSGQYQQNGGRPSAVQSPTASSFAPSVMNSFGTSMMFSQMQMQQQQQYHQQILPMHGLPSSNTFFPQLSSSTTAFSPSSHASPPPSSNTNTNSHHHHHHQSSKAPSLLTPSGRAFAVGGRVQNISRDELNPVFMFWPENEPLPAVNQIRPPTAVLLALGGVHGPPPPILNTGNKGPIDAQPGDWTCGKCDYLNWRRRRVCANCFPHADGNSEGTKHSTSDVQERVAILASVLLQQQQQIQAQQLQQQQQQQTRMQSFANVPDLLASSSSSRLNSARRDANGGIIPAFSGAAVSGGGNTGLNEMAGHGVQKVGHQKVDPLQILASKYGYAIPPPSAHGMHPLIPMQQQQQPPSISHLNPQVSPNHPLNAGFNPNLPPRLAHGPGTYGDIGSGVYAGLTSSSSSSYVDPLKHDSLPFGPLQARAGGVHPGVNGGVDGLNGLGGRQTSGALQQHPGRGSSPTSSRSSVSLGHGSVESSSYAHSVSLKIPGDEPTPSPLPLLPAFLQEVVGDASETSSSRSSIHESPSPPSSSSTSSSPFGNVRYPGGGSGSNKRDQSGRNMSGSQFQQYSSLNRNASQSSIWSLGFDYGHAGDIDEHKFARV